MCLCPVLLHGRLLLLLLLETADAVIIVPHCWCAVPGGSSKLNTGRFTIVCVEADGAACPFTTSLFFVPNFRPLKRGWRGKCPALCRWVGDDKKKKQLKTRVSCREGEIGGGRKQIGTLFLAGWRKVLMGAGVATVYTYTSGQRGCWGSFSDLPPEKTADQMWEGSTQETPAA